MVKSIGAFFLRKLSETLEMIRSKLEIEFETFVRRYERGSLSPNGHRRCRFKILRPEYGRKDYTFWMRGRTNDGTVWNEAIQMSLDEIRLFRKDLRHILREILVSLRFRMSERLRIQNTPK